MRLINIHTLEARDFGAHLPPYAILSYDWAQHHDNIFSNNFEIANKYTHRGYALLQAFCDFIKTGNKGLAADLEWQRIDWCYIHKSRVDDKTALELPDGVARLYETCTCRVVYLRDEGHRTPTSANGQVKANSWFRHGAVLQELTIPPSVVLVNIEWYILPAMGAEDDCELMADVTGIPAWRLKRRRSMQMAGKEAAATG